MPTHRSNRGIEVDFNKLRARNEKEIAIGNTKTNARGDQLGRGGKVAKSADKIAQEHYKQNAPRTTKQTTIKTDDVPQQKPMEDDWEEPTLTPAEPPQDESDPWVEDAEGNFVRQSELEEKPKAKGKGRGSKSSKK